MTAWQTLWSAPRQAVGVRLLRLCFAIIFAYKAITEWTHRDFLYEVIHAGGVDDTLPIAMTGELIVSCYALAAALLLYGRRFQHLGAVFGLIGTTLAEFYSNTGDGGDNLLRITLIYLLFLRSDPSLERAARGAGEALSPGDRPWQALRNGAHNLAVLTIIAQVCVVYFSSSTAKLQGEMWTHGTAMYYVSQLDWFRSPFGILDIAKHPYAAALLTYGGLFYQLYFPALLLSRLHLPVSAFGILFHIGIAVLMGIVTFSMVMIGLILFCIRDREWAALQGRARSILASLPLRRKTPQVQEV